jgi:hypothetical protein
MHPNPAPQFVDAVQSQAFVDVLHTLPGEQSASVVQVVEQLCVVVLHAAAPQKAPGFHSQRGEHTRPKSDVAH